MIFIIKCLKFDVHDFLGGLRGLLVNGEHLSFG